MMGRPAVLLSEAQRAEVETLFMNTGATAAAVAFDCAGGYVETDF